MQNNTEKATSPSLCGLTDEQLYSRFLAGDTASYDELMIRLGDRLIVYINAYLHDWHDSEDLMIEAFARIMVRRPAIRSGGFTAYLYWTARNLAARSHANTLRTKHFSLDSVSDELSDGKSLEERVIGTERRQALHRCLERIDTQIGEVLWLIYFEEMTYAQAASVMGVTPKRIDKLLQKGKEKLRAELEEEGITNAYG